MPFAIAGTVQENLLRLLENERIRFAQAGDLGPQFSIVTPMYNTPPRLLQELIWSVQAQTWVNWELLLVDDCSPDGSHLPIAEAAAEEDKRIKVIRATANGGISGARNLGISSAVGDWVGFLDHDDLLHPQALGVFLRWISDHKDATFVFSNEVKISEDSRQLDSFFSKAGFCRSTLLRANYIAHLVFIKRNLIAESRLSDGRWFRAEFDGVEDHDFFLRVSGEKTFRPQHIPLFLYYWRKSPMSTAETIDAKPYVQERGMQLVQDFLKKSSLVPLDVARHLERGGNWFLRVRFEDPVAVAHAKVLVVIPFRDGWRLTKACLDSLEHQNVRVFCVLVDNSSRDPGTLKGLGEWLANKAHKHSYVKMEFPGPFNFAQMNNRAVAQYGSDCSHVLFLNNDVELTDQATLATMISNLEFDPEIAFCGIRLDYPGAPGARTGGIQHGGIKFGLEMRGGPFFRTTHMHSSEEFAMDDHVVSAVTFACAMVRRDRFNQLGGLEEDWLPNGLGDVDICLRAISAGYRNFYLGSVMGIHHESKTRKDFCEDVEQVILFQRHGGLIQSQMLRQLGYDTFHGMLQESAWFTKPLRYRIADRINFVLKRVLGPFHRQLRNTWKQWESKISLGKVKTQA